MADPNQLQRVFDLTVDDITGQPLRIRDYKDRKHLVIVLMRGLW